eukprot:2163109-Alexandrium_andersonii.AAC.1
MAQACIPWRGAAWRGNGAGLRHASQGWTRLMHGEARQEGLGQVGRGKARRGQARRGTPLLKGRERSVKARPEEERQRRDTPDRRA